MVPKVILTCWDGPGRTEPVAQPAHVAGRAGGLLGTIGRGRLLISLTSFSLQGAISISVVKQTLHYKVQATKPQLRFVTVWCSARTPPPCSVPTSCNAASGRRREAVSVLGHCRVRYWLVTAVCRCQEPLPCRLLAHSCGGCCKLSEAKLRQNTSLV